MEENRRTAQEIRQEIANILKIPVRDDIENEYEHAIQYQLDDWEVDRIAELRNELKEINEKDTKESEDKNKKDNKDDKGEDDKNKKDDKNEDKDKNNANKEKLKERIDAYESGSSPELEAEIYELRIKIEAILDKHGLKDSNGKPKVKEGEGQLVEEAYVDEVTKLRDKLRGLAAKREDKVSQKGQDVLPVLKELYKFLDTPEGEKEGAYAQEVARLIDENKKSLKNIEAFQKDSKRVQELKKEITEINEEIAKINAKVKEDPNHDAESIKRTELNVTLFHRQNELRGILARNPNANENIDTSRATAKLENIINELESIQKEIDIDKNDDRSKGTGEDGSKGGNDDKGKEPPVDEDKDKDDDKDKGKDGDGSKGEDDDKDKGKDGDESKGEDDDKDKGKDGDESKGKDDEKGKEPPVDKDKDGSKGENPPQYKVGRIRGWLLKLVQAILLKVKPDGFLGKFFGGVEDGLLIGAKETSLSYPKLTTVPEKSKTDKSEKVTEDEAIAKEEDSDELDSKWAQEQLKNIGSIDKDSLMAKVVEEALNKSKKENVGKSLDELQAKVEKDKIPQVLEGKENAFQNILYYNVAGNILDRAEKEKISLKDKNGKDRPISEIFADLEKKELRRKTDEVSRKAAEARNERESGENPKKETPSKGEEK